MTATDIEVGLDSFVPISVDDSGHELRGDVVIRNTVDEAVLADAVGIDSFNDQGRRPRGSPDRLAVAAAGNDADSVAAVMRLIDRLGFDAVNAGPLNAGVALQPGTPLFGIGHSAEELTKLFVPAASRA